MHLRCTPGRPKNHARKHLRKCAWKSFQKTILQSVRWLLEVLYCLLCCIPCFLSEKDPLKSYSDHHRSSQKPRKNASAAALLQESLPGVASLCAWCALFRIIIMNTVPLYASQFTYMYLICSSLNSSRKWGSWVLTATVLKIISQYWRKSTLDWTYMTLFKKANQPFTICTTYTVTKSTTVPGWTTGSWTIARTHRTTTALPVTLSTQCALADLEAVVSH